MGFGESKDTVFLINFSIMKHFQHPASCIHICLGLTTEEGRFVGMLAFVSLNSHLGSELSWRDDLEALAYILLFLCSGSLPWLSLSSYQGYPLKPLQLAICISKEMLTTGSHPMMPPELLTFLSCSCNLSFTQKLDTIIFKPPSFLPLQH